MLGLFRTPSYSLVTVLIPGLIFIFIGASVGRDQQSANFVMASFAIFASLGAAFFQFGVGIANERKSPWEHFARVLPVSALARFGGNVLTAMVFTVAAVGILIVIALMITDAGMSARAWIRMLIVIFAGTIPMALFGIAIGYWAPVKAALPIANLFYLGLSFGGGLFIPPQSMPDFLAKISMVMPTRHIAELAWASVAEAPWPVES